jgi:acyl transferase domain-containing protein
VQIVNGNSERMLGVLQDARRQLELERDRRSAPIAIVGMGCRFPGGAVNPAAYWELLRQGAEANSAVPADRWDNSAFYHPDPDAPGKSYVKSGGFLEQIAEFDPAFFGISPREALGMDPQQRLLLEVSWEALEDAGIPLDRLKGSATGVWIGSCADDYARRTITSGDLTRIDPFTALGNTRSVAAGRIAYALDLRGPVVQLDTACSSSLVAVHQACQSLRAGECDLALVGGVNLMCAPETMVALCKLRALAADGRCKPFDASADGYGRGEGCGMVVLARLSDALLGRDRIYALVRGTAVNHDGHSNGLTAPNGMAQRAVIRSALASANLDPASVSYVEAHGTGTLLGDPMEVLALGDVYGQGGRKGSPLYVGSVKANLGHLEGAAGIAGLIKVALCLSHARIVPQRHLTTPNPKIPWNELPLRVPLELMDWPEGAAPRRASLSSFGLSGTNARARGGARLSVRAQQRCVASVCGATP